MALKEMAVPESPKLYTTRYDNLGGVDYSTDITEIDRRRTPTGTNMISDDGSYPVKRLGWRVINELNHGRIIKMLVLDRRLSTSDSTPDIIVVTQNGVYGLRNDMQAPSHEPPEPSEEPKYTSTTLYTASSNINECALFTFNDEAYLIFAEGMYKVYSGGNFVFQSVLDNANIPIVSYGTDASGNGSTSDHAVNILSTKRSMEFVADGTSTVYYFYPDTIRNDNQYKWIVADTVKVEQYDVTQGWKTLTKGTDYTLGTTSTAHGLDIYGNTIMNSNTPPTPSDITVAPCEIHFTNAPQVITNWDNSIRVTFEQFNGEVHHTETINNVTYQICYGVYKKSGALNDFLSAFTSAVYGYAQPDRVFIAGSTRRNYVYYSAVNDPTYFPDNNYLTVGHDDNEIMSLQRVSEYLAVVKGESVFDNTMYLISGAYLEDNMYFKVIPTSATIGAISRKASAALIDEPLFLSRFGVFGVANTYTNTEKAVRNRSRYVDKKLVKERNLREACATVWNKYYILCVNDHCYVLDGRNVSRADRNDLNYQYEAYYWEGIPAVYMATYLDEIYFGTADGRICKFNTDVNDSTAYCDNGVEVWEYINDHWYLSLTDKKIIEHEVDGQMVEEEVTVGLAIPCEWSTPYDDDRAPQYFKTLNKKGNLVTLLPMSKSSAEVSLIKDGAKLVTLEKFYVNIFSWASVLFEGFSFRSDLSARDDFFKKKVKKYKRLQITVSNNEIFEPFGILGITKTYSVGNFSK